MAKRYIPLDSFSLGRGKVFVPGYQQIDGTQGYTEDQVSALSKKQLRHFFQEVDISGGSVVEQATAAPGEKRTLSHECSEGDCDFTSTTAAGIAAHERSH